MEKGDFKFEKEAEARCPCGAVVRIGYAFQNGERVPVAMHKEPTCKEFREKELIEYLQWIRLNSGIPQA